MSPEYALEGLFSVKSDVFSFGVVLLEIISGERNTRLVQYYEQPLSLLGYVSLCFYGLSVYIYVYMCMHIYQGKAQMQYELTFFSGMETLDRK